jgi:hypothetical protein
VSYRCAGLVQWFRNCKRVQELYRGITGVLQVYRNSNENRSSTGLQKQNRGTAVLHVYTGVVVRA